jgi:glycyl-tRNA synthetase beta chain
MKRFNSCIRDLVSHPKVQETRSLMHHSVPKHEHLLRSAAISYRIAPLLGADRKVCARAALLHDLDSRHGSLSTHGRIAARVAAQMGEPEPVCRAIVPHMYPLGPAPTSREGWVLVLADKLASIYDMTHFLVGLLTGRSQRVRRTLKATDPFYQARQQRRRRRFALEPRA